MKISIAICTWNRSALLKQTLQSLVDMRVPQSLDWELLLIDNRSTDNTPQVIDGFRDALPIRYLYQPVPGHSASRNAAIELAAGKYILWTDNDVVVPCNWLEAYAAGFQAHPDAAFFGGKIEPVFKVPRPDWLVTNWEKCKGVYATRDLGDQLRELNKNEFPYGANFAVRMDVQRQFRFDTQYGRMGKSMVGDEEIAALRLMVEAGHRGVWLPNVGVQHIIPADRINEHYVAGYFVGQGQTNIVRGKVKKSTMTALFESLRYRIKWWLKQRNGKPEEWVSHMIRCSLSRGEYLALREKKTASRHHPSEQGQRRNGIEQGQGRNSP